MTKATKICRRGSRRTGLVGCVLLMGSFGCGMRAPAAPHAPSAEETFSYEGSLALGRGMIPVSTILIRDTDGFHRGAYAFLYRDRALLGMLSECRSVARREIRCRWQDPLGIGALQIAFADDLSSFNGFWTNGLDGGGDRFPWNGRLVSPKAAPASTDPTAAAPPRQIQDRVAHIDGSALTHSAL